MIKSGVNNKNLKWFAMTRKLTTKLTNTPELTKADFNFLFFLLNEMNRDNCVVMEKQEILEKRLKLTKRTLSRSIQKLIDGNIIVKTDKPKTYMINPRYVYTGGEMQEKKFTVLYEHFKKQ